MAIEAHGPEGYLEAIYELNEEGAKVVQARIAERLGVSRAAVSEQVKRLVSGGFLESASGREITLTAAGSRLAEQAVRRHRMAERFLTEVLRMPWHLAHAEAENFQGAISGEVEARMMEMLGGPATCPHGNPIPGTGAVFRTDLRPLNEFVAGDEVILRRLLEDVELDSGAMLFFEQHKLMPGSKIRVTAVSPDGTMSLDVEGIVSALGVDLADNLFVEPGH